MITPKQQRFVEEYLIDLNATAAAQRAGYKDPNKGRQLVTKSNVAEAIQKKIQERSERVKITQDDVISDLINIKNRCMDEPFDPKNALKALELLGKHLGMFTDKVKTENTGNITFSWKKD